MLGSFPQHLLDLYDAFLQIFIHYFLFSHFPAEGFYLSFAFAFVPFARFSLLYLYDGLIPVHFALLCGLRKLLFDPKRLFEQLLNLFLRLPLISLAALCCGFRIFHEINIAVYALNEIGRFLVRFLIAL